MYRILTLDGGGSWAVLEVMTLAAIYGDRARGLDILRDFDLVAANSGGSITLGGLLTNRTLADLRDNFFLKQTARETVFVRKSGLGQIARGLLSIGPKYDTEAKLRGLRALLAPTGDIRLSALPAQLSGLRTDVMICAFDYDRLRGILFRSNRKSRAANFAPSIDPTLAEAIHASTDAPINFFDAPAQLTEITDQGPTLRQYWDGGIAGYNNPALVAVMEALANGIPRADIRVLSLGTGTVFRPFDRDGRLGALGQTSRQYPRNSEIDDIFADLATLATAIVDDPPDLASYFAHLALGGAVPASPEATQASGPLVRLNPVIQPVLQNGTWISPPGITDFRALAATPMDAVDDADVARITELGRAWMANTVPNQPIRMNRETLACEIGQPTFDRALAVWQSVGGAGT